MPSCRSIDLRDFEHRTHDSPPTLPCCRAERSIAQIGTKLPVGRLQLWRPSRMNIGLRCSELTYTVCARIHAVRSI